MVTEGLRLKEEVFPVRGVGKLRLRPIMPEDESLMVKFHEALSEESVYTRYFAHMGLESRVRHERLLRICTNSEESFALVAARAATAKKPGAIYAVGRLSRTDDPLVAEFALLVDDWAQGFGIGSALIKKLVLLARACGFRRLMGEVLVANHEMLNVSRHFGFSLQTVPGEGLVRVSLDLEHDR